MEVHDHPIPYPLGWVDKHAKIKVTKQCKIRFSISANFIDEVEINVVHVDVCGLVFGSHYMYMWDAIFMGRVNEYCLIKDGKSLINNAHKGESKI